jgi:hypothetical protein
MKIKMKKFLLLILLPIATFAQKDAVVYKKLAEQTCTCITSKNKEKVSEMELGICVLASLGKLSEKEKKAIDYLAGSDNLEKVSERIGMEMVSVCPEVFSSMLDTEEAPVDDSATKEEVPDPEITGIFQSMISGDFKTIELVDDINAKSNYIWLFPFDGDAMFIKNKIVKGDKIKIRYREQSFFDPKKNEYRMYNEILGVELL